MPSCTLCQVLGLLRSHFFPHEPAAAGLSLCPPGYRIPALERDIARQLGQGRSFLATDQQVTGNHRTSTVSLGVQDQVVGVVICTLAGDNKDREQTEEEEEDPFPETFLKLERFFADLKKGCDLVRSATFYILNRVHFVAVRANARCVHTMHSLRPQRTGGCRQPGDDLPYTALH